MAARGEAIRVVPQTDHEPGADRARRLRLFDWATERQHVRQDGKQASPGTADRGWSREDLYARGSAR